MMRESFFIAGTDTGVGKTVVSLLFMQVLCRKGYAPLYVKPFQTGCVHSRDRKADARFIYTYAPEKCRYDSGMSTLCCFRSAKAPYFAARDEGARIDVNRICRKLDDLTREQTYTHVVMEGAGGLLVPVTADRLVVDIMQSLQAHVILVGRAGLGTINHTLLSVEALERRGLRPKGIVLISKGTEGSDDLVRENMEAIETFSGIRPAGVIGPIRDFTSPGDGAYDVVETLLSQTMRKDHAGKRDIGHR